MAGVYLVYRNRIFRDAMGAILGTHSAIKLVGAADRPETAAIEIAALSPDVILLEEVEGGAPLCDISCLLTSEAPSRLITLRLDQDGMHVWSQIWRHNVGPQDLVSAIMATKEEKA